MPAPPPFHAQVNIKLEMATSSPYYKRFQANFDRLVNAVSPVVAVVARKAFQENLISSQNLKDAQNPMHSEDHRSSNLLLHILGKIEENSTHFDTFVSILHSVPVLTNLAQELSKSVQSSSTAVEDVSQETLISALSEALARTGTSQTFLNQLMKQLTVQSTVVDQVDPMQLPNEALPPVGLHKSAHDSMPKPDQEKPTREVTHAVQPQIEIQPEQQLDSVDLKYEDKEENGTSLQCQIETPCPTGHQDQVPV